MPDSIIYGYYSFGNGALFSASTKETGAELYQSDGSSAGTALLKDNVPGKLVRRLNSSLIRTTIFISEAASRQATLI